MKYDKEILERVQRSLENERIRIEAEAEERKRRVYTEIPRIAEIDAELKSSVFEIIRASFGKGTNPTELIASARKKNEALQREREELLCGSGYKSDFTEPKYSCEVCSDTGISCGEICPCVTVRYRKALAKEINSGLKLRDTDFAKFDLSLYPEDGRPSPRAQMKLVYDFCRDFAADFGEGSESLYMSGKSGLGKSFLASCIANEISKRDFSVIYTDAFTLLGEYEDVKFGRSDKNLDVYETCDLLIIDDVGSEMSTPFTVAALFSIINRRGSAGKSTVVITTLPKSEGAKRYGAQLASRLEGEFVKLEFLGEDVRLKR